jgi:hypothetical protein
MLPQIMLEGLRLVEKDLRKLIFGEDEKSPNM